MEQKIESFFEKKKRDLSSASTSGDERKKLKGNDENEETYLSFSDDQTDVFTEGLKSPRCASI